MTARRLPSGWSEATLADVVQVTRPRKKPQDNAALPFIGMEDVESQTMRLLRTQPAAAMKSQAVHFLPGDVLYGRLRPYLNKVLAPNFEGLASAEFIPMTPRDGISADFIALRLNASDFVQFASHLNEGDRPRVDWPGIRTFGILVPPKGEQARIVEAIESYLSRLDDAVASLKRAQARLKAYRASVLKAAAEGRLVPTEAALARAENRDYEPADVLLKRILAERRRRWEEVELAKLIAAGKAPKDERWKAKYVEPESPDVAALPELPAGWTWTTLAQLTVDIGQGWSPQCEKRPATGTEWGVIKTTAVQPLRFLQDENKALPAALSPEQALELRAGDLLITRAGPRVRVGICCLVRTTRQGLMLCDKVYRVKVSPLVSGSYLEKALNSPFALAKIEALKTGISDSGLNLTQERFLGTPVPLPPAAEQARIDESVDEQLTTADVAGLSASTNAQRAARLRQGILQWAFGGVLTDRHQCDEPADQLLARIRATMAPPNARPRTGLAAPGAANSV